MVATYPITSCPIDQLDPNPWNPNKQSAFMFEKELNSIKEFGFVDPVTVRQLGERKQVLDGFHRLKAAKQLGHTEILIVNLGEVSDAKAKTITDVMNNLRGRYDPYKQARLIQAILAKDERMRALLPYKDTQLDRYIKDVDWSKLELANRDVLREAISFSWDPNDFAVVNEAIELARSKLPRGSRTTSHVLLHIMHAFLTSHERLDDLNDL